MRGSGGAMLVVATLLVCSSAEPHQEQDLGEHNPNHYDINGHKTRNLDPLGGGNLVREVRQSRYSNLVPYFVSRKFANSPNQPTSERSRYNPDDLPKRNFDEIDRSNLDTFNWHVKRNFDEIDRTSMPFPYAVKRVYRFYEPNYLDMPVSSFDKKRYRADFPMDEIDLSHFPVGSKRSADYYPLLAQSKR